MSEKKLIIFDLDGTINDSSPGISYCFVRTGEHYGKTGLSAELLHSGLSGPFEKNIMRILDLRPEQVSDAIQIYVKYYTEIGQGMSQIFPGTNEVLEYLSGKGYMLSVATMMVEEYAFRTLQKYHLDGYFSAVKGTNFTTPLTKQDLIESCLMANDIEPSEAVMIGDGIDDYKAATAAGVDFIGAVYGYEITEEFCNNCGTAIARSPLDLKGMF